MEDRGETIDFTIVKIGDLNNNIIANLIRDIIPGVFGDVGR